MNEAAARALLVYGYEPSGHAAAAFALGEALSAEGFLVSSVEVSSDHHPAMGRALARAYHGIIRSAPGLWGYLYASDVARSFLRKTRQSYLARGGAGRLRAGVARRSPSVIVCPQASVAAVFAEARRRGDLDVPVVSVLTDFAAHPFWADPPADLTIAPTAAVAAELRSFGVPSAALRVYGVPISSAFASLPSRADARRALGLPSAAPVVLVSGGSKGLGGVDRTVRALLKRCPRALILALCGADDSLRRALGGRRESATRLRVFGAQPTTFVATLLAACDLHLGKPGGMTAAESLAAGAPMVLTNPLPGQEEGNARHLVSCGAAVQAEGSEDAADIAAALLARPEALAPLCEGAAKAGRPHAARAAAREIGRGLTLSAETGRILTWSKN